VRLPWGIGWLRGYNRFLMSHLIVTTINRTCPATECSGYVYIVDAEQRRVLSRYAIPEAPMRAQDPNPRGGMRGGRGIAVRGAEIFIANFDTVYRFDAAGNFTPFISHPSCADIHDIAFKGERLWVTSTRNDLVLVFDGDGNLIEHHNARTWSRVRAKLNWHAANYLDDGAVHAGHIDFRNPTTHEKEFYDGAHVNSVCLCPGGDVLLSMGLIVSDSDADAGKGAIVRLREGTEPDLVYFQSDMRVAIHNLALQPDGTVLFLDTGAGALTRINPDTGALLSRQSFASQYLRGLHRFEDGRLAIGDQNSILFYDPAALTPHGRTKISENSRESVHSIISIENL